ncbi:hypothetical protein AVEN_207706-1 [Araneus ventricosus]|uniref:CCHC-type domain-containing protein n=1 Tax=Araneus ventricosus TaxID=182803 RepID=A0A4Y2PGE5_ARAVE|nr:hypothetical protein AVEN_207706-1 [Araneus ventricosus]
MLGSLDVLRIAVSSAKPPQGLALFRLNPCVLAVHGDPLGTKCNPGVPLRSLWPMVLRKSGGRSEPALVNRLVVRSFGNGEVLLQVVNLNVVGQHNNSKTCSSTPTCVNCKGDHPAYAKVCPRWKEKEIQSLKTTQNLFFAEARKISDRTPKVGVSYSTATKKVMVSKYTQYEPEPTENVNVQVVSEAIQAKSVSDSNNNPGKTETQSGPSANNKPQKLRKSSTNETFHSVSPFLVEKAISGYLGEIPSIRKLRSGDLLVEVSSQKQAQIIIKLNNLASIPVTVTPHPSLNFSKGVVSCGELLNTSIEEIADKLKSQGVAHVRRISMRKGELLETKHLVLTFHGSKIPESIKAGYMKLAVRHYFPNPLRCFKCQRFGHSKASCRGTLTCARCAEAGHDSSDCKASEKCVNCKGSHTSFSRLCSAWKFEKEVIAEKVRTNLSYIEARRIVKSRTPTLGTSYATAAQKKLETTNSQILPSASVPFKASYTPSEICPRFIDPVLKLFLTDTHKETVSSQSKLPESNKST